MSLLASINSGLGGARKASFPSAPKPPSHQLDRRPRNPGRDRRQARGQSIRHTPRRPKAEIRNQATQAPTPHTPPNPTIRRQAGGDQGRAVTSGNFCHALGASSLVPLSSLRVLWCAIREADDTFQHTGALLEMTNHLVDTNDGSDRVRIVGKEEVLQEYINLYT